MRFYHAEMGNVIIRCCLIDFRESFGGWERELRGGVWYLGCVGR